MEQNKESLKNNGSKLCLIKLRHTETV